jgi:hypothetical protein
MEWKIPPSPKRGDRRITKKFCFIPQRCDENTMVWLGFIYLFQYYTLTWDEWATELTFSSLQYKRFLNEISTHLIDPREDKGPMLK